jgi:CHAT domain-containing protein/tetratricopeptide (TPR) repeat protein
VVTSPMNPEQRVAFAAILVLGFGLISGVPARAGVNDLPGVVVEEVERNSAAERTGLRKGDVIFGWNGDGTAGEIRSPLDILAAELEESPRAPVTFNGLRQSEKRAWVMGPDHWGIVARPELPVALASTYREGQRLAKAGKIKQAAGCWTDLAATSEKRHFPQLAVWFLFRAATLLSGAQQWKDADEAYSEALRKTSRTEPLIRAQILHAWASSYMQRGDWVHAEKEYQEAIAESQTLSAENLTLAASLDEIGMISWRRSDLARAEEYCRRALAIRMRLAPGSLAVAQSLDSVGTVVRYPRGSGLAAGEEYYRQALAIQSRLAPEGADMASSLNGLGIIAWQRGDLATADDQLHRALKIAQRLERHGLQVAYALNELGTVADLQGDPAKSKECYTRSLAIRTKLAPRSWELSQSLHNLGLLAQEQGDASKGEYYTRQALDIDRELGGPESLDVAGDYNDLSYIARDRGDFVKAERYQLQAVAIEEKTAPGGLYLAETLNSLGDLSRERGNWAAAEDYYRKSLSIREKLAFGSADHAATLAGLAWAIRKSGQPEAAQAIYDEALTALESQTARLGGSQEIQSGFRAAHARYYKDYVDLLLEQKRPELALQVLERSRARMLLEMMTAAHVDIRKGVDSQLLERKHRLEADLSAKSALRIQLLGSEHTNEQLATVQKEIERTLAEHEDVEGQIRTSSPRYAALVQPEPLGAAEIQHQLLDADTLLLEYSLGDERSHVLLVSQDSLTSYPLPKRTAIEEAARLVYELLTEPNRVVNNETALSRRNRLARASTKYAKAVSVLSQMVLGPVADQLGNKRLLIVSDGALQYIPFAILPTPGTGGTTRPEIGEKEITPLVAQHEIINLPSASVLGALRNEEMNRAKAPKAVAVLADPVFDREDPRVNNHVEGKRSPTEFSMRAGGQSAFWNSLPASRLLRSVTDVSPERSQQSRAVQRLRLNRLWFTRLEADTILANTLQKQGMKAVNFRASRETATSSELAQYRIVHFATHGLLDSRNPELSGLVFSMVDANGKAQNGFLELQDIYNLNLPVEMVVLSACETGLGKEIDGEGLVGLTRGFMYAGASRVVASLWRVSDFATAQLMGEFYKAMEQGGMRPAAALRMAQIKMAKQKRWASPYYWAGFQIQGEWK